MHLPPIRTGIGLPWTNYNDKGYLEEKEKIQSWIGFTKHAIVQ